MLMNIVVAQEVMTGRKPSSHSVLWIAITFAVIHSYQDRKMALFTKQTTIDACALSFLNPRSLQFDLHDTQPTSRVGFS